MIKTGTDPALCGGGEEQVTHLPSMTIHWTENKKTRKSWMHENHSIFVKQSKWNSVKVIDTKTAELKVASHVILGTELHLRRQPQCNSIQHMCLMTVVHSQLSPESFPVTRNPCLYPTEDMTDTGTRPLRPCSYPSAVNRRLIRNVTLR